jgi:hypothetical protein
VEFLARRFEALRLWGVLVFFFGGFWFLGIDSPDGWVVDLVGGLPGAGLGVMWWAVGTTGGGWVGGSSSVGV